MQKIGSQLLFVSVYLLALSIPVSIAGDNIAIGIGIFGLLLVLFSKDFKGFPPIKPLLFFLMPPIFTMISQGSLSFFRMSSINQHVIPYFQVFKALKKKKMLDTVLLLLGISSIFLFISLLFGAVTWQNIEHTNLSHLSIHMHLARAKGFLGNPLTASSVITLILFLFFGLYIDKKKFFYLIVFLTSSISLVLAQSRSSWLGFIVGFVVLLFFIVKSKKQMLLIFLIIFLFFVSIVSMPTLRNRFLSSFNPDANYSNIDRLVLWDSYIKSFEQYSVTQKFFGAGKQTRAYSRKNFVKSFEEITGRKVNDSILKNHFHGGASHDIYLRYLGEVGIIGLFGYILFWLYILRLNIITAKISPFKNVLLSLNSGYIAFLTIGIFEDNFVDATVKIALMFVLGINFYIIYMKENKRLI